MCIRDRTYDGLRSHNFTGQYTKTYISLRSIQYLGTYTKTYTGQYQKNYVHGWTGQYTKEYEKAYIGIYTKEYSRQFSKNWFPDAVGDSYQKAYEKGFVGSAPNERAFVSGDEHDITPFTNIYMGVEEQTFLVQYVNSFVTGVGTGAGITFTNYIATLPSYEATVAQTGLRIQYSGGDGTNVTHTGLFGGIYVENTGINYQSGAANYIGQFEGAYHKGYNLQYTGGVFAGPLSYKKVYGGTAYLGEGAKDQPYMALGYFTAPGMPPGNTIQTKTFEGTAAVYYEDGFATNYIIGPYAAQYEGTFTREFLNLRLVQYTHQYSGTYNKVYKRQWEGSFDRGYEGAFETQYEGAYDKQYEGTFSKQFEGSFTKQYEGAFDKAYLKTYERIRNSTVSFIGSYVGFFTGYYDKQYEGTFTRQYEGTFDKQFTGFFNKQYEGSFTGFFTNQFEGQFSRNYIKQWSGIYSQQFTGYYDGGPYVTQYGGVYTKLYLKQYQKEYTGTYARQFEGLSLIHI